MKLEKAPWQENEEICEIFELLDCNARLVGGCVRDFLLYGKLVYDIDIATPFKPDAVIERLSKKFNVIPTGLQHGTVTVVGSHKYEVTTLRCDENTDGRHAQVNFNATWEQDSVRRDFTINALYVDLDGNVYDYHSGLKDLEKKCVRFIGEPTERICEDYLRIMRFFRFSTRFGSINQASLNACLELVSGLLKISGERITQEWFQIVGNEYFWEFFEIMKPILDVIGFDLNGIDIFAGIKKEDLSGLGVTSVFYNHNWALKLSNEQKKYIMNLRTTRLYDVFDAIMLERKWGPGFVKDKMILENKFFEIPELGQFPINGSDIIAMGFSGKEIGLMLDKLYSDWIKKFGKISKEKLLEAIK